MATLTVANVNHTGNAPTLVAVAAGGDQFANDGHTFLYVKNTNGASRDVTVDSVSTCSQGSDHNIVVTVPATTGERLFGPFPTSRFNDANGMAQITYEADSGVTIQALRLEPNP